MYVYMCDQYDFVTHYTILLKTEYSGVKYPCDICDYASQDKSHLNRHKDSVHLEIEYNCYQCEFSASTNDNLRQHKKRKHEHSFYSCAKCDYVSKTQ